MLRPRKVSRNIKNKSNKRDLLQSCRLCGIIGGSRVPIIQETMTIGDDTSFAESTEIQINQKIQDCVSIEVKCDDKLPLLICLICLDKVNDFYEFRHMCSETNIRLHKALGLCIEKPQPVGMVVSTGNADNQLDCILGVDGPVFFQSSLLKTQLAKGTSSQKLKTPKKEESQIKKEIAISTLTQINDDILVLKRETEKVLTVAPMLKVKRPNRRELNRSKESAKKEKGLNVQNPKQGCIVKKRKRTNVCQICGRVFPSDGLLQYHLREIHSPKILEFGCTPCGEGFHSIIEFKNHHIWHKENSVNYNCQACLGTFRTYRIYSGHIDRKQCIPEYEVDDYWCNKCNLKCETENILLTHECVFDKVDCKFCGKIFSKPRLVDSHERQCKYSFLNNLQENSQFVKNNSCSVNDMDSEYYLPRKLSKKARRHCKSNKIFKPEPMEYNINDHLTPVSNCIRKRNRDNKLPRIVKSEQIIDHEDQLSNLLIKIEPEDDLLTTHQHIKNNENYKPDNVTPKPHLKLKIKKEHGTLNSTIIECDVGTSFSSHRNNKRRNDLSIAITQVKSIDQEEFDQATSTVKPLENTCKDNLNDDASMVVINSELADNSDSAAMKNLSPGDLNMVENIEENHVDSLDIASVACSQVCHSDFEIKQEPLTYDDSYSCLNKTKSANHLTLIKCEFPSADNPTETYSDLPLIQIKSESLFDQADPEVPNINQNLASSSDILGELHNQASFSALPIITSTKSLDIAKWNAPSSLELIKNEPITQEQGEICSLQFSSAIDNNSEKLGTTTDNCEGNITEFSLITHSHHHTISCVKLESLISETHNYQEELVIDNTINIRQDFNDVLINSEIMHIKSEPIDVVADMTLNSNPVEYTTNQKIITDDTYHNKLNVETHLLIKETQFNQEKSKQILEQDSKVNSVLQMDADDKTGNNTSLSPTVMEDKISSKDDISDCADFSKSYNAHIGNPALVQNSNSLLSSACKSKNFLEDDIIKNADNNNSELIINLLEQVGGTSSKNQELELNHIQSKGSNTMPSFKVAFNKNDRDVESNDKDMAIINESVMQQNSTHLPNLSSFEENLENSNLHDHNGEISSLESYSSTNVESEILQNEASTSLATVPQILADKPVLNDTNEISDSEESISSTPDQINEMEIALRCSNNDMELSSKSDNKTIKMSNMPIEDIPLENDAIKMKYEKNIPAIISLSSSPSHQIELVDIT